MNKQNQCNTQPNAWPGFPIPVMPGTLQPNCNGPTVNIPTVFASGATRDTDHDKYDYEGFLCPLVIERFGQYMHKNRKLADGSLRDSDNWQKGIPLFKYIKSLWRHTKEVWKLHRGYRTFDERGNEVFLEDALCGVMFNAMGYLHETLKSRQKAAKVEGELKAPDYRFLGHAGHAAMADIAP